jgi:hypothetical protein
VHAIYYVLLDGKSGTEVLQKHPYPTINSRGGRDGVVSLAVSIEAGKQLECSIPHGVSFEPGCDAPCVFVRKKSYSDTNAEELDPTATEPNETLQKERKTRRLQECSSSNATRRSWTNVQ